MNLGVTHAMLDGRDYITVTFSGNGEATNTGSVSKTDLGTPVAKSDPIFPALKEHQNGIQKRYDERKEILLSFSEWYPVESPAAQKLFMRSSSSC